MNVPYRFPHFATAALMLSLATQLCAQSLTLRLVVSSRVPSTIAEWNARHDAVTAYVSNPGDPVDARFEAELTRDGELLAETRYADMPVVKIPNGVSTFTAENIIPEKAVTLHMDSKRGAARLAPGTYTLSTRLCAGGLEMGLCLFAKQTVVVADIDNAPTLHQPENNDVINPAAPVLFSWLPAPGSLSTNSRYRIQIFALPSGASAVDAMNSGAPIITAEDSIAQFMLKPGAGNSLNTPGTYAWTVTELSGATGDVENKVGRRAEPFVFVVK